MIYPTYGVIHARGLQTLFLVYPKLLFRDPQAVGCRRPVDGVSFTELIRFRALADAPRLTPPV